MDPADIVKFFLILATLTALSFSGLWFIKRRSSFLARTSATNLFSACLLFYAWVFPISYQAIFDRSPPAYKPFDDVHNLGGLFARSQTNVAFHYIQIQLEDDPAWIDLPEEGKYSSLVATGYTKRLPWLLVFIDVAEWRGQKAFAYRQRDEVAKWIAARHQKLNPGAAAVTAVRFLYGWQLFSHHLPPPEGRFRVPPLASLEPENFRVLSQHPLGSVNVEAKL